MPSGLPVIRTKILVPRRRSELLSRSRLLKILGNTLDLKLFILAAPAGYGKTSLLVDFSHHNQAPVCWYALDALDSDPKRFIAHFIASIQEKFPDFGNMAKSALAELNQDNLNLDPVISAIVNDIYLNISEHFIFILDDFHLVRDSKVTELFVNRIIQESPENCHFIVASRTLLTLPDLSLLVARSQVDGLSFEELAFLPEEIKQLMSINYHQSISNEKAEELITNTEGWITGLLLTTQISPKGPIESKRIARVSGVDVYEYLAQQVFDRQSRSMQSFLLRTSLLEEFDANLCEEIFGKALNLQGQNWNEVINQIQRDNLFVLPVGDESVFLRYHHLFRDFLQNRIRVEKPDEATKIEIELADYLTRIHDWERAVPIYFRVGTEEQQWNAVCKAAPAMIMTGRLVTLTDWLNALPGHYAHQKPELLSIRGSIAVLRGEYKDGLDLLNRAVADLRVPGLEVELGTALIRRSAVNRHLGRYEEALHDALEAESIAHLRDDAPQKYFEALRAEGLAHYYNGGLSDAKDRLHKSHRGYLKLDLGTDAAKVMVDLGVVFDAQGDLEQAEKCFSTSLQYWQDSNNALWQANTLNNIGVIQHKRGQYEQAVITLEKALSYSRIAVNPRLEVLTLLSLGDLYRDLRALHEARLAYDQANEILEKTNELSFKIYLLIALSILDRLEGKNDNARTLLREASSIAQSTSSSYDDRACMLEESIMDLKAGNAQELVPSFTQLEEYFENAGYQAEGFKAATLNAFSRMEESPDQLNDLVNTTLNKEQKDSKYQILMQIGLEFQGVIQRLESENAKLEGIRKWVTAISEFKKLSTQIQTTVKRHSTAVKFESPSLTIRGFGKMQVSLGDKLISGTDWKTKGVRDLFFYLLSQPEGVTKEEIGMVFWPEADPDAIRLRFKNSIYRLRRAVGTEAVSFTGDVYKFNSAIDFSYDVIDFLEEIKKAKNAVDAQQKMKHLSKAVSLYHGDFLPKMDQDWVTIEREKLRQDFMRSALTLMDLYLDSGKYTEAISISRRALEEDLYDEAVYRGSMVAYSALNDRPAVARQFERCKQLLKKDLNLEPSPQTIKLYNSLTQ